MYPHFTHGLIWPVAAPESREDEPDTSNLPQFRRRRAACTGVQERRVGIRRGGVQRRKAQRAAAGALNPTWPARSAGRPVSLVFPNRGIAGRTPPPPTPRRRRPATRLTGIVPDVADRSEHTRRARLERERRSYLGPGSTRARRSVSTNPCSSVATAPPNHFRARIAADQHEQRGNRHLLAPACAQVLQIQRGQAGIADGVDDPGSGGGRQVGVALIWRMRYADIPLLECRPAYDQPQRTRPAGEPGEVQRRLPRRVGSADSTHIFSFLLRRAPRSVGTRSKTPAYEALRPPDLQSPVRDSDPQR